MKRAKFITLSVYDFNRGTVEPKTFHTALLGRRVPIQLANTHQEGILMGTHISMNTGYGPDVLESEEEIKTLIDKANQSVTPDPNAKHKELAKLLIRYEVANTWWLGYITNDWLLHRLGIWIGRRVKRKLARYDRFVDLQQMREAIIKEAIEKTPF